MMPLCRSKPFLNSAGRAHIAFILSLLALLSSAGCRADEKASKLVVVKAPVTGEVRRVLASEGATVSEGAILVEISVSSSAQGARDNIGEDQARARAALGTAQKQIAEAEAEVNRAAVETQRIEPLVRSGAAPQSQLDAARGQYQQAQERLDRLRESARSAQSNVVRAEGRRLAPEAMAAESIVEVRVPEAGTIRVLRARAGQQIIAGQPIATLSADQ